MVLGSLTGSALPKTSASPPLKITLRLTRRDGRFVRTMMVRLLSLAAILLPVAGAFPNQTKRPRISVIAFVRFKAVDFAKSTSFYSQILGLPSGDAGCHGVTNPCFVINPLQHLELVQTDSRDTTSFLDEVGFTTNDLPGMRSYLANNEVKASEIARGQNGLRFFEVTDPEHNRIAFVEASNGMPAIEQPNQVSRRLYHVGWVVKNLETRCRIGERSSRYRGIHTRRRLCQLCVSIPINSMVSRSRKLAITCRLRISINSAVNASLFSAHRIHRFSSSHVSATAADVIAPSPTCFGRIVKRGVRIGIGKSIRT